MGTMPMAETTFSCDNVGVDCVKFVGKTDAKRRLTDSFDSTPSTRSLARSPLTHSSSGYRTEGPREPAAVAGTLGPFHC
jgi:hypothetical protein